MNDKPNLLPLTAQIVAAQISRNPTQPAELPALIRLVHDTLLQLDRAAQQQPKHDAQPAVAIKKSITPEYLICLEDGKKLKMLKRHLKTMYNMTPEQYREKWGLPADYPMVAPNYARQRSALAKEIGLGTTRQADMANDS